MADEFVPKAMFDRYREKSDKRFDRIERAIFGHDDPETNLWIDGILQRMADTVVGLTSLMWWLKWVAFPFSIAVVSMLFLLVARAYGWSWVGQLIRGLLGR